jgi:hypothetical protein
MAKDSYHLQIYGAKGNSCLCQVSKEAAWFGRLGSTGWLSGKQPLEEQLIWPAWALNNNQQKVVFKQKTQ